MLWVVMCITTVVFLTACQSTCDIRGNLLSPDDTAHLKPLQHTQEDVLEVLGPPFEQIDKTHWLYIGQEQETKAFLLPEAKKQRSFLVTFDNAGRYLHIEERLYKRHTVAPDPETSSVESEDLTVVGQTLDNLRRSSSSRHKKKHK
jgi:outer membrane protein assembly factor BamE (lipoprotein component of BamABCDE complex)